MFNSHDFQTFVVRRWFRSSGRNGTASIYASRVAGNFRWRFLLIGMIGIVLTAASACRADRFTYRNEAGETVEVEARLAGSGQGLHALELADGQFVLVPQAAVMNRVPEEGPEPIEDSALVEQLTERFGAERFRAYRQKPYVIGLVLSAPLARGDEGRATGFLKLAARFMRNVEGVFMKFAREMRLPTEAPRFPLVVLIFESDDDFEEYALEATGGTGISAGNIAGFYSALTNWLAIRLSECHTFETPLHEAIHQQVHNRGILQRLAPVPAWFNEGIATGFEANGERINVGPSRISARYARLSKSSGRIDWATVVADDGAFRGDVLAGEAYAHAWGLHWMVVTNYKTKYMRYVQMLAQREPLAERSAEQRLQEFEETFGMSVADLQREFHQTLDVGIRKQRIQLEEERPVGLAFQQTGLAEIGLSAVTRADRGGILEVEGKLKNISPIRAMSFYVTVETNSGTYADWHLPNVPANKVVDLPENQARKLMANAPGGPSRTFRVRVRSTVPDSDEGKRWSNGRFPVPIYGR